MQKICVVITAFLILLLVGVCSAANWQTVTTFTGTSDTITTTNPFNVPTTQWRLIWSFTPNSSSEGYALFWFYIYQKGESEVYTDYLLSDNETSGTFYVHEGSKDYYLQIGAYNTQNYNINIEYDSSAPVPEFSTIALIITLVLVSISVIGIRKRIQNQKR